MKIAIAVFLMVLAGVFAKWQFSSHAPGAQADLKATRLTFDYKGNVAGVFQEITSRSGVKYKVSPAVAEKPFEGSFKDKTVIQVQQVIGQKAGVRYAAPDAATQEVPVSAKL